MRLLLLSCCFFDIIITLGCSDIVLVIIYLFAFDVVVAVV